MSLAIDRQAGLKRSGEMMLSGWRMLAQHCQICSFPLMSKGTDLRCPGCDLPVKHEREVEVKEAIPSPPEPSHYDDADVDEWEGDDVEVPASFEELKKEYDLKNKRSSDVSAKLGQKMLAGWILLGDVCPTSECRGTPLMKAKGSDDMMCVSCDQLFVVRNNSIQLKDAAPPKEATLVKSISTAIPVPFNVLDAPFLPSRDDDSTVDASEKISKKLLLGWAMLDRVCDGACNGSVPLMRNKAGEEVCVVCHGNPAKSQSVSRSAISTSRGKVNQQISLDDLSDEEDDEIEKYKQRRLNEIVRSNLSNSDTVPTERKTNHVNPIHSDINGVRSHTSKSILEKITEVTSLLKASDKVSETIELSNALVSLSAAYNSVQNLK